MSKKPISKTKKPTKAKTTKVKPIKEKPKFDFQSVATEVKVRCCHSVNPNHTFLHEKCEDVFEKTNQTALFTKAKKQSLSDKIFLWVKSIFKH